MTELSSNRTAEYGDKICNARSGPLSWCCEVFVAVAVVTDEHAPFRSATEGYRERRQSRTQSPQAPRLAVGRQERLWETGILLKFFDWLLRNQLALFYRRNPAVNSISRVFPGDYPLAKERKGLWIRD